MIGEARIEGTLMNTNHLSKVDAEFSLNDVHLHPGALPLLNWEIRLLCKETVKLDPASHYTGPKCVVPYFVDLIHLRR